MADRHKLSVAPMGGKRPALLGAAGVLLAWGLLFGNTAQAQVVPGIQTFADPSGVLETKSTAGDVNPATNPFFQTLGLNPRSCATCHVASDGMGLSISDIQAQFNSTGGTAVLFCTQDVANCSNNRVTTLAQRQAAYSLFTTKGLVRVPRLLAAITTNQWSITAVNDPYGCETSPKLGLSQFGPGLPTQGFAIMYRRVLPTGSLPFVTSIGADGKFPNLFLQAVAAISGHEQPGPAGVPKATTISTVNYELSVFTAQLSDSAAGALNANGATGGPDGIAAQTFQLGQNDPFGGDPNGKPFNPHVFSLFDAWTDPANASLTTAQRSIGRGQTIFNSRPFTISGVAGLNDVQNSPAIAGTCSTCHNTPNVGTHSLPVLVDEGLSGTSIVSGLDLSYLPVFTVQCNAGPLAGQVYQVTDIGQALVTGNCADIGKIKIYGLRGVGTRAPYFHNGAANTLTDLVNFYNQRFSIGLSTQDRTDLVNFLNAL
jgi:cytochrome c peroxidase